MPDPSLSPNGGRADREAWLLGGMGMSTHGGRFGVTARDLSIAAAACYRAATVGDRARVLVRKMSRLLKNVVFQRAAASLVGAYLRLALATTRWTLDGIENIAPFFAGGPMVLAFWHERISLMPAVAELARRANADRRVAALASRHRDGRFIGAILRGFGVRVVHGSTDGPAAPGKRRDRGGAAGLRALRAALAQGDAVVITPDGPRGPRRVAAPGVAQLAALAQAPVVAASAQVRWRLTLPGWDRMVLPLPFSRGALVFRPAIAVPPASAPACLKLIEAAMTEAAERADALCGR